MGVGVGAAGVIRGNPLAGGPSFSLCPPGSDQRAWRSVRVPEISGGFLESVGTVCRLVGFAR